MGERPGAVMTLRRRTWSLSKYQGRSWSLLFPADHSCKLRHMLACSVQYAMHIITSSLHNCLLRSMTFHCIDVCIPT